MLKNYWLLFCLLSGGLPSIAMDGPSFLGEETQEKPSQTLQACKQDKFTSTWLKIKALIEACGSSYEMRLKGPPEYETEYIAKE